MVCRSFFFLAQSQAAEKALERKCLSCLLSFRLSCCFHFNFHSPFSHGIPLFFFSAYTPTVLPFYSGLYIKKSFALNTILFFRRFNFFQTLFFFLSTKLLKSSFLYTAPPFPQSIPTVPSISVETSVNALIWGRGIHWQGGENNSNVLQNWKSKEWWVRWVRNGSEAGVERIWKVCVAAWKSGCVPNDQIIAVFFFPGM